MISDFRAGAVNTSFSCDVTVSFVANVVDRKRAASERFGELEVDVYNLKDPRITLLLQQFAKTNVKLVRIFEGKYVIGLLNLALRVFPICLSQ